MSQGPYSPAQEMQEIHSKDIGDGHSTSKTLLNVIILSITLHRAFQTVYHLVCLHVVIYQLVDIFITISQQLMFSLWSPKASRVFFIPVQNTFVCLDPILQSVKIIYNS